MKRKATKRRKVFQLLLCALWLTGCGDYIPELEQQNTCPKGATAHPDTGTCVTTTSLVNAKAWQKLTASEDPFKDRPEKVRCPYAAEPHLVNGEWSFGVHTGICRYLTARQPALVALHKGDTLQLKLWHYDLSSSTAAEAHVAIRIGKQTLWDITIPIPSPKKLHTLTWTVSEDIPKGTPIYFHLHNHGANEWSLLSLTSTRPME